MVAGASGPLAESGLFASSLRQYTNVLVERYQYGPQCTLRQYSTAYVQNAHAPYSTTSTVQ